MQAQTLDGHQGRQVVIDICLPCQSLWFDTHESLSLTPGSTLALFRTIGEQAARPTPVAASDTIRCPRCRNRLTIAHDMQRTTRFSYLRCPEGHGRLTAFVDFLREKDFIRPLSPAQIQTLRASLDAVNCSNCGAAIDLHQRTTCGHCGSALSMLDLSQAEALVAQLQKADARERGPVDPALPLELARARRQTDLAFEHLEQDTVWISDASSYGLVGASLMAMARWLKRQV
jgi:ribosomal protein S27AE